MAAPRVFVSHSHSDNEWCRAFVAALQVAGWSVWYDERELSAGAEWVKTIQRELQARDVFLLVLTPASWTSEWVQEELNLAFLTHRQVVPVLHQDTPGVGGFLLGRQWVRVVGLSGADAAQHLVHSIAPPILSTDISPTAPSTPPTPSWLPPRLASLGFKGHSIDGVELITPPLFTVPAGDFLMGSDKQHDNKAIYDELPQHQVTLRAYQIARFPVTVAEYACFIRAGHEEIGYWQIQLGKLDHPVVHISWDNIVAYVRWLAKTTGQPWRLPSEAEWEKAARGSDGQIYPWGDQWDRARANTCETDANTYDAELGTTTPVGIYRDRGDASPCGAHDMAGNVWELTSSFHEPYPYRLGGRREDLTPFGFSRFSFPDRMGHVRHVRRGGSWRNSARYARAAYRHSDMLDGLNDCSGFRLMLLMADP